MLWRSPAGEDVLWIATEGGVARTILGQHRWRTATLMGSAAIGVFGVRVEPDGRGGERLWVGASRDGLGLYEGGRWRRFSAANGALPDNDIRALRRAPDVAGRDALWLGTGAGHLIRVHEGPRFETIPTPWPSEPNNAVMDVLGRRVDGEHELWVATRLSGVHRLRRSGWTAFELEGVSPDWRPTTLLEQVDRAGRSWLWSTSADGLARFDGNRWVPLRGVTGLPERSMLGINLWPDDEGRQVLWVGTGFDGLVRLDVSDPLAPRVLPAAELPPPIDPAVYGAVRDSQGRLYLCTNNGVQQLTPVPGGGWRERVFHRRDGMVHEECNTNAQFMDEHDRFWTGTLGGLTVYDPASPASTSSAALRLVDVRVDGETVATDGLRLLPGLRELHAEFTLQTWQREGENRYRTRLLGLDTVPGPWTASAARTFTALPPGSYQLHVEARDHAGNEAQPLVLSFVVVPAWWQTRVARVLLVAVIVMLAALLFHWRTRSLRRQKSLLEAQVQMRTEQLNAANRQLWELSYTDALTGLANRRRMREQLHSLLPADGTAAVRCSMIFIDIDTFKAYNDRLGHPAGDEALRVVAHSLQACAPQEALVARYGGEEFACLLPHMEPDRAFELAERMRRHVAEQTIPVPGTDSRERATISAGVATAVLATESDIHRLMREADAALYRAKDEGRNRVRA